MCSYPITGMQDEIIYNIKIATKSLDSVAKLKYFVMTAPNQNYFHEELKRSFTSP
jgi:hypothetical protein